jgi:replicative DNA helicase
VNEEHYNLAFERSVLATIIFDPSSFKDIKIKATDFYLASHQSIYKTMELLDLNDIPIDESFLKIELEKQKKFDERAMVEILTANPVSNYQPYIEVIKKHAKTREVLSAITHVRAYAENNDGDDLLSELESTVERLRYDNTFDVFSIQSMHEIIEEETEFICKDFIPVPKKTVTIFSAGGGTGKTMASIQLALRFIEETSYKEKVFMWLSEDPVGLSKGRAIEISSELLGKHFDAFKGCLDISGDPTFSVMTFKGTGEGTVRPEFFQMKNKLKQYSLIIIDPLIGFFTGQENDNGHARQFMQLFTQWAIKEEKTIIFIHHSSKGARIANEIKSRGASAFTDAGRAVYEFEKIKLEDEQENKAYRRVILSKDNYNAIKFFGSYQKDIQIFPEKGGAGQGAQQKATQKLVKPHQPPKRNLPPGILPGMLIEIVDEPEEKDDAEILDLQKKAESRGVKFE